MASAFIKTLFCTGLLLSLAACERAMEPGSAKLSFKAPAHPNVSSKSLNTATATDSFDFCYAVVISGADLNPQAGYCHPASPVFSGFVEPLSLIELNVEKGKNRKVELYGYILEDGKTCAEVNGNAGLGLDKVPVNHLFAMGSVDGVDMTADEVQVTLTMIFPGLQSHLGNTGNYPHSCMDNTPAVPAPADPAGGRLVGSTYMAIGQISSGIGTTEISGGTYKIKGDIKHVTQ